MKQKQITRLLIVCIAFVALTALMLSFYLALFMSHWSGWSRTNATLSEIQAVDVTDGMKDDLAVGIAIVILHVVFYQVAICIGIKNVSRACLIALLGTVICAVIVYPLPIYKMVDYLRITNNSPFEIDHEIVIIELTLISISYIVGIIYAIRHYPKVKKEKVKTD